MATDSFSSLGPRSLVFNNDYLSRSSSTRRSSSVTSSGQGWTCAVERGKYPPNERENTAFWGTLAKLSNGNGGFGGGVSCFEHTSDFCSPIAILTSPSTIGTNPSLSLSLETRFYSLGLDTLLACCFVDFFVFVRNGPSFTTSHVYPWRRGRKFCRNGLQGREGEDRKTDVQGQGRERERCVFLFY
jgi:hypothetical protein